MDSIQAQILGMSKKDEDNRLVRIARAQAAFQGEYSDVLKVKPGQVNDNTKPNLAKLIVRTSASFLMGETGPMLTVEDSDSAASKWLDACLLANRSAEKWRNVALSGGTDGHVFIKLSGPKAGQKFPTWSLQDAATVVVHWDPRDMSEVLHYKIEYNTLDEDAKPIRFKQMIKRESPVQWSIQDFVGRGGGEPQPVSAPLAWNYPFAPIIDCQNLAMPNVYYGASDLEPDILHLIERIHFILSGASRLNRLYSHPRQYGSGFQANQLNVGADELLILPTPEAKLQLLEAPGDMTGSMKLYEALRSLLFELSQIPPVALAKLESVGALSGVALKILYTPLANLTADKRLSYGWLATELGRRLLMIANQGEHTVTLAWPNTIPENDAEQAQALMNDLNAGIVSKQTASEARGYDWSHERPLIEAEADSAAERMLSAMQHRDPGFGSQSPDNAEANV